MRKPREETTYLLFILRSFVVRISSLMTSFQSVFSSVVVFPSRVALCQVFAFIFMPFLVLLRVPLVAFCLFW